jgi:hypothetical protein
MLTRAKAVVGERTNTASRSRTIQSQSVSPFVGGRHGSSGVDEHIGLYDMMLT